MRPSDVLATLIEILPTREPIMLWGPPGVGKSDLARAAVKHLEWDMIDRRVAYMDAVDAGGFPTPNGDMMSFTRPDFCPAEGKGLVFLDEFAQGVPLVQASMCQFLLDKRIRDHKLGAGWSIMGASNRTEDRAGANRIITPVLNRLIHLDLEVSNEDWQVWAGDNGIAAEVRAFLRFKRDLLFSFEPSKNERAFPTPRSWAKLSNILPCVHADRLMAVASGTVGEAAAAQFIGYCQFYREMPDLDLVLANPEKAPVPKELSVLWGLSTALVDKLKAVKTADPMMGQGLKYIKRLPAEISILTMQDMLRLNRDLYRHPVAMEWLVKNREFVGGK